MQPTTILKRRLYFFLMVFAILGIGLGIFFHLSIRFLESYTVKISLASRQKSIAEELSRKILQMHPSNVDHSSSDFSKSLEQMQIEVNRWESAQKALVSGSSFYGTQQSNSTEAQIKLQLTNADFVICRDFAMRFIQSKGDVNEEQLKVFLKHVDSYGDGIHQYVGILIQEDNRYSRWIKIINGAIVALMVLSAFLFAKLVLLPWNRYRQELEESIEVKSSMIAKLESTKTDFLANISNEIRTPLNGLLGMTDILATTQLDNEQRDYVRHIQSSSRNLLDLINDVLDFSKLQTGSLEIHKERFCLTDCVEQVIDMIKPLAAVKHLEIISHVDSKVPLQLVQDEFRIRQVLLCLVNNAIKFTEKGEVTIQVELINEEADFVQLKFSIKDTGIGIDPTRLEKLFQPFYQLDTAVGKKYQGAGLGLPIAYDLAKQLGGSLWVESQLGIGSTFYFTVVAETAGNENREKFNALKGLRALVVDDNNTNLKILVKQLSVWGIQTTPFNSPDLVAEILQGSHKFDLVIMDMQMPGMDGNTLAKKIRKKYNSTELPIIVLSALGEHLIDNHEGLYNAFLTKPVKQARLLDTIVEVNRLSPSHLAKEKLVRGNFEMPEHKSNLRILVAQDNELSRAVTAKTLELLGHKFETVTTASEAVERTHVEDYDLILMDLKKMDKNSLDTAKQIKKYAAGKEVVPVIFGLTENEQEDMRNCSVNGMDDVVPKPMQAEVLQEKILHWLEVE